MADPRSWLLLKGCVGVISAGRVGQDVLQADGRQLIHNAHGLGEQRDESLQHCLAIVGVVVLDEHKVLPVAGLGQKALPSPFDRLGTERPRNVVISTLLAVAFAFAEGPVRAYVALHPEREGIQETSRGAAYPTAKPFTLGRV